MRYGRPPFASHRGARVSAGEAADCSRMGV